MLYSSLQAILYYKNDTARKCGTRLSLCLRESWLSNNSGYGEIKRDEGRKGNALPCLVRPHLYSRGKPFIPDRKVISTVKMESSRCATVLILSLTPSHNPFLLYFSSYFILCRYVVTLFLLTSFPMPSFFKKEVHFSCAF